MSAAKCYHGDPLLDEMESLRSNDSEDAKKRLITLCVHAVQIGLFPNNVANPMKLVRNYGARWFEHRDVL